MADTASLIARVKTEGVEKATKQLDELSTSAGAAEASTEALSKATKSASTTATKAATSLAKYSSVTEQLGNAVAVAETAQEEGARAAMVLAAQLKLSENASAKAVQRTGELAGRLYDLRAAEAAAAQAAATRAQAVQQATAGEQKAAAVIAQLEGNIKLLTVAKTQGASAAAALSNQMKAGAGATEAQKAQIEALTVKMMSLSNASNTAGQYYSKGRIQMQQAGYQIQDLIIQLQSGTSAFVAFGQQGSQLAGAFGPGGAVLGAVIALASAAGGILYRSFGSATTSAKDLEMAAKSLQGVLRESSDGALRLADDILKLARVSSEAAKAKLAASIADANLQIKAANESAVEAARAFSGPLKGSVRAAAEDLQRFYDRGLDTAAVLESLSGNVREVPRYFIQLKKSVVTVTEELGIVDAQAIDLLGSLGELERTRSPEAVRELAAKLAVLQEQYGASNAKLSKFNSDMQRSVAQMAEGKSAVDALNAAYSNFSDTLSRAKAQQAAASEAFVKSLETQTKRGAELIKAQTDAQITAIKTREDLTLEQRTRALAAAESIGALELKELEERESKKTAKAEESAQKRADAQEKRQQKQVETFLEHIDNAARSELERITANEQQKLSELEVFYTEGLLQTQRYEEAKTAILAGAEMARKEELDKRKKKEIDDRGDHDQYISNIQALNATELELIDIQNAAREAKAKEMYDKGIINEQEYQDSLSAIRKSSDKQRSESSSSSLAGVSRDLRSALGEHSALYKHTATIQATIDTYKAANAAYASQAAIPIYGPALGVAAAAAAVAAGLARVGAIRAAREQGGYLSPGQASWIGERGQAEVIVPGGASRVRTAEQMRKIMGDDSKARGESNIIIINQTTGRIDKVEQDRDDEGRLRLVIQEVVASDLQDSNSDISKSLRETRGQPGF